MYDAPATRKDIDDVLRVMRGFIQNVYERFNQVDVGFERIDLQLFRTDNRLGGVEKEMVNFRSTHEQLMNTIDAFIGRIDRYETEQVARDGQFDKLLAWARKVSEKTGIPLENL